VGVAVVAGGGGHSRRSSRASARAQDVGRLAISTAQRPAAGLGHWPWPARERAAAPRRDREQVVVGGDGPAGHGDLEGLVGPAELVEDVGQVGDEVGAHARLALALQHPDAVAELLLGPGRVAGQGQGDGGELPGQGGHPVLAHVAGQGQGLPDAGPGRLGLGVHGLEPGQRLEGDQLRAAVAVGLGQQFLAAADPLGGRGRAPEGTRAVPQGPGLGRVVAGQAGMGDGLPAAAWPGERQRRNPSAASRPTPGQAPLVLELKVALAGPGLTASASRSPVTPTSIRSRDAGGGAPGARRHGRRPLHPPRTDSARANSPVASTS
jgi:hypothetical protein